MNLFNAWSNLPRSLLGWKELNHVRCPVISNVISPLHTVLLTLRAMMFFLFCSTFGQISSRYSRITEYGPIVINIEKLNGNTLLLTWSYFHKLFTLTAISASESAIVAMLMNYVWGAYVIAVLQKPTNLLSDSFWQINQWYPSQVLNLIY